MVLFVTVFPCINSINFEQIIQMNDLENVHEEYQHQHEVNNHSPEVSFFSHIFIIFFFVFSYNTNFPFMIRRSKLLEAQKEGGILF